MKEKYHSMKIKNNKPLLVDEQVENSRYFPEEALGFKYAYKNLGLYKGTDINLINNANSYWGASYGQNLINPNSIYLMYRIPRLW
ncbi:MAG: hypothetical protein Fur0023_17050 [Bacteroidia bacterium]